MVDKAIPFNGETSKLQLLGGKFTVKTILL
jgi:hypothetical protein